MGPALVVLVLGLPIVLMWVYESNARNDKKEIVRLREENKQLRLQLGASPERREG
jgi:hypothetical protein